MLAAGDIRHKGGRYRLPLIVIVGCLLCIAAALGSRRQNAVLLVLYLAFVVYMTLIGERAWIAGVRLDLFWSYRLFFISPVMRLQILNNSWLFVPLGAMLYRLWPRGYVVLIPVLLSLGIETLCCSWCWGGDCLKLMILSVIASAG